MPAWLIQRVLKFVAQQLGKRAFDTLWKRFFNREADDEYMAQEYDKYLGEHDKDPKSLPTDPNQIPPDKPLELYPPWLWPAPEARELYDAAKSRRQIVRSDPLIVDLDVDGIETRSMMGGYYFDQDVNGFSEKTGWVSADDGLLVLDRNGDGVINNGGELFGDQTVLKNGRKAANGFQALAELDGNQDGKIDINDAVYSQLRVWQDINGNGVSEGGELKTLAEHGITSVHVTSTVSNTTDPQGQHTDTNRQL